MNKNTKRLGCFHSPLPKKSRTSNENDNEAPASKPQVSDDPDLELKKELESLKKEVEEKEEMLRKLNLAKMYQSKKEFADLPVLTQKWKTCCQQALQDLHSQLPEPRPTMLEFFHHMQIEPSFLSYNAEDDVFET